MIYYGNEKENHPAILSTHTYVIPDNKDIAESRMKVANGNYTKDDLKILVQYLNPTKRITEVESVEIIDIDDITQEEE